MKKHLVIDMIFLSRLVFHGLPPLELEGVTERGGTVLRTSQHFESPLICLSGSNATPLVSHYSCRYTGVAFFALCFRSVARESRDTPSP